jgi:hypothetical protein
MEAYPVSTIVNSARGDSPEMIAEMDAEEPLQMRQSGFSID